MISSMPISPRSTRLCRKPRQCSSCSFSESDTPRIRRLPSRFTPLANQHGCIPDLDIEPHLLVQSIQVQVDDCAQRSVAPGFQDFVQQGSDRLTCVDEISLPHNRSVIAATLRVDTPCTYISANASINARSLRNPFSNACG